LDEMVKAMVGSCSVFIIAHRLSTVMSANKIVIIEQGVVHEQGTHAELMRLEGIYSSLVKLQATKDTDESKDESAEDAGTSSGKSTGKGKGGKEKGKDKGQRKGQTDDISSRGQELPRDSQGFGHLQSDKELDWGKGKGLGIGKGKGEGLGMGKSEGKGLSGKEPRRTENAQDVPADGCEADGPMPAKGWGKGHGKGMWQRIQDLPPDQKRAAVKQRLKFVFGNALVRLGSNELSEILVDIIDEAAEEEAESAAEEGDAKDSVAALFRNIYSDLDSYGKSSQSFTPRDH